MSVKRGETVLLKEKLGTVITKNSGKETITELQIWKGSEKWTLQPGFFRLTSKKICIFALNLNSD